MAAFIRVDIWSLTDNDPVIRYYADAVRTMKAKPPADVTSWDYQAAIHAKDDHPARPLWNECRHQGWFFLPWHRAYLYYFERIVRAEVVRLGGPSDWALPYWNYEGGGDRNQLPTAFRSATLDDDNTANPLYVSKRKLKRRTGIDTALISSAGAMKRTAFTGAHEFGGGQTNAMSRFAGQTGRLEATPHNDIHSQVGGLMLNPYTAALDPIFWLHHCNIDRLWWSWQKANANPGVPAWSKPVFPFFDAGGVNGQKTSAEVEDIERQLDYVYDSVVAVPPPPPLRAAPVPWPSPWPGPRQPRPGRVEPGVNNVREMVGATQNGIKLVGSPVKVSVPIDPRAAQSLERQPMAARQHRAFLEIENVDAERNPGAVYGVYVNLPAAPTDDDLTVHHVGNVSMFGIERAKNPRGDEPSHLMRFSLEITDLLDYLAGRKAWTNGRQLDVTLRPITLRPDPDAPMSLAAAVALAAHPETPIRIGRISVHYE